MTFTNLTNLANMSPLQYNNTVLNAGINIIPEMFDQANTLAPSWIYTPSFAIFILGIIILMKNPIKQYDIWRSMGYMSFIVMLFNIGLLLGEFIVTIRPLAIFFSIWFFNMIIIYYLKRRDK